MDLPEELRRREPEVSVTEQLCAVKELRLSYRSLETFLFRIDIKYNIKELLFGIYPYLHIYICIHICMDIYLFAHPHGGSLK